jgi:hypothetical protein
MMTHYHRRPCRYTKLHHGEENIHGRPCMAYRRTLLTVSDRSVRYRDRVQRLWRSLLSTSVS